MRKVLFFACAALAVFGCGGDLYGMPPLDGKGGRLASCTEYGTCTLSASIIPSDGGSVSCYSDDYSSYYYYSNDCNKLAYGLPATVTANPSSGYRFVKWLGDSSSTNTSISITMDGNKTLTAEFELAGTPGVSVTYGGETYHTVVIGSQTWFGRNLNYNVSGSVCYYNNYYGYDQESNCTTYGRLYDWATAMNLPSNCNSSTCSGQISTKHQGICPTGWHIPSQAEWDTLSSYVQSAQGCSSCDAKHLKATNGWDNYDGVSANGLDTYGFSALPGGFEFREGTVTSASGIGNSGYWWSTSGSAYGIGELWSYQQSYHIDDAVWFNYGYTPSFSVRCLMD